MSQMIERYQIKTPLTADWITVSKSEWIVYERRAGFQPKLSSDHPDYMSTCATGGFCGNRLEGRII